MDVGDLYNFGLLLVLIGIAVGIGILVLDKIADANGVTAAAQESINASRDEISGIATNWLGIVVIVVVAAIILGVVVKNLGGAGRG